MVEIMGEDTFGLRNYKVYFFRQSLKSTEVDNREVFKKDG